MENKMTTSKFDPFYIARSIIVIFFTLFFAFFFFAHQGQYFGFTQQGVLYSILFSAIFVCLNYLIFHRLIKVIVAENDITFKNLVTRRKTQIKFDEIERVIHENESYVPGGRFGKTHTTSRTFICLLQKNGDEWWFNDGRYSNFQEIDEAIRINLNKIKNAN